MINKRFICLLLALVMISALTLPMGVFAEEPVEEYYEEPVEEYYEELVEEYYEEPAEEDVDVHSNDDATIIEDLAEELTDSNIELTAEEDVISASVQLPTITTQPEPMTVAAGEQVTFTIVATNADSYQWEVNTGTGWKAMTNDTTWKGNKTDTLKFSGKTSFAQYEYRCVVTNASGSVESNVVTFTISSDFTIDSVTYHVIESSTNVLVKSFNDDAATNVVIPTTVVYNNVTYTVSEIGEGAFENKTALQSVTLPNSITVIGKRAFKNCSNLSQMDTH